MKTNVLHTKHTGSPPQIGLANVIGSTTTVHYNVTANRKTRNRRGQ